MSKTSSARSSSVEYASDVPDTPVTADAPRQRIEVRSFWDTAKDAHKAPCLVRSLLTGVVTASAFGIVQNLRGSTEDFSFCSTSPSQKKKIKKINSFPAPLLKNRYGIQLSLDGSWDLLATGASFFSDSFFPFFFLID
jgi:hypothetical protein